MLIEAYKQPQFTCQADMVADSSLTPSLALLVHPSGTTHFIVDCHKVYRVTEMMMVKADLVICSFAIGVSG